MWLRYFFSTCLSGGVEPIAEVADDGEELPQESTKFIKKKQPSKKVKKGRNLDFPISILSLGIWSSPVLKLLVLLHFASTCPMLKYMPPTLKHCSQIATKSQIQP